MCFSSYKNHILKVKLWWYGAHKRKNRTFFVPLILFKENFFNICVLFKCTVCWMYFQNIHAFTYQKTLLHTLFGLFLKSLKAFSVSLMPQWNTKSKWFYEMKKGKCNSASLCWKEVRANNCRLNSLMRMAFGWLIDTRKITPFSKQNTLRSRKKQASISWSVHCYISITFSL